MSYLGVTSAKLVSLLQFFSRTSDTLLNNLGKLLQQED